MKKQIVLFGSLLLLLFLVACGGTAEPTAVETETTSDTQSDAMMEEDEMMEEEGDMMAEEAHGEDAMADEMSEDEMAMDEEDMAMEEDDEMAMEEESMAEDEMSEEHMADEDMADDEMMEEGEEEMMEEPMADLAAWQTLPLVNAATGESFTLADFAGKTIFVEPMATWCSNCRQQLDIVTEVHAALNPEEVVIIGLSVETAIDPVTLANYAESFGYNWTFAVMSPEMVEELTATFGRSVVNPPSTPHFIIRSDGTFTELDTGMESADELLEQINAARS